MEVGIVKWFNNAKGFGFIAAEGDSQDIFVHYSVIDMDGFRTLKAGQNVQFEASRNERGAHATKVVLIKE